MHAVNKLPIAADEAGSQLNAAEMHHGPMNRALEIDLAPAGDACSITRMQPANGESVRMAAVERVSRPMAHR